MHTGTPHHADERVFACGKARPGTASIVHVLGRWVGGNEGETNVLPSDDPDAIPPMVPTTPLRLNTHFPIHFTFPTDLRK